MTSDFLASWEDMMDGPGFEMPRLVAGIWRVELAPQALAIYGDAEVTRMLHREPVPDEAGARQWIQEYVERNATFPAGCGIWPLFEKDGGALVGSIVLKPLPECSEIEVGWHLGRFAWGKGYATEAGQAAIAYGFAKLGLDVIYAITLSTNTRSMNVCRRVGMKHLGKTDKYHGIVTELFAIQREGK
ncbi:MAG: GNAT family N-acetyltransferase [Phycisphaerales bacterium]|nr:GNAT family N-acetyltransferase [Phycisphaerales bacterium]